MPSSDLVEHGSGFLQVRPGIGQHDIHGAQKYMVRTLPIAEQPIHDFAYGDAEGVCKLAFIARDEAGLEEDSLVRIARAHNP